jgi:hypothetical protein
MMAEPGQSCRKIARSAATSEPFVSMNALAQIYFHARCALRRPANWRWHLAGVRRALVA